MSSKMGLVLSMLFVGLFFAFGIDLVSVQIIHSDLDAKSQAISYQISKHGTIDDSLKNYIEQTYGVNFRCTNNCAPLFGDVVTYVISRDYQPIIIKQESMTIAVSRTAVIGYYN